MSSTKRKNPKSKDTFRRSATSKLNNNHFKINSLPNLLIFIGLCFLVAGVVIPILTLYPVLKEEIKYKVITNPKNAQKKAKIKPINTDFGIVIPKINANAKVIANVNPYHEDIYQKALTQGVAHAEGTSLPGQIGNTFIFAHSSGDWYTANQYNSVFYLLNKLNINDEIVIYYQNFEYKYRVIEKKIVEASEVDYLTRKSAVKTVTLMTCWPPSTTLKRLIVVAELAN